MSGNRGFFGHSDKLEYYNQVVFARTGLVAAGANNLRITNEFGGPARICKVSLATSLATSGALTVDIHKNGTTIFTTQTNRPSISSGVAYGSTIAIDVPIWNPSEYITMEVDSVGTAYDLVVIVVVGLTP